MIRSSAGANVVSRQSHPFGRELRIPGRSGVVPNVGESVLTRLTPLRCLSVLAGSSASLQVSCTAQVIVVDPTSASFATLREDYAVSGVDAGPKQPSHLPCRSSLSVPRLSVARRLPSSIRVTIGSKPAAKRSTFRARPPRDQCGQASLGPSPSEATCRCVNVSLSVDVSRHLHPCPPRTLASAMSVPTRMSLLRLRTLLLGMISQTIDSDVITFHDCRLFSDSSENCRVATNSEESTSPNLRVVARQTETPLAVALPTA